MRSVARSAFGRTPVVDLTGSLLGMLLQSHTDRALDDGAGGCLPRSVFLVPPCPLAAVGTVFRLSRAEFLPVAHAVPRSVWLCRLVDGADPAGRDHLQHLEPDRSGNVGPRRELPVPLPYPSWSSGLVLYGMYADLAHLDAARPRPLPQLEKRQHQFRAGELKPTKVYQSKTAALAAKQQAVGVDADVVQGPGGFPTQKGPVKILEDGSEVGKPAVRSAPDKPALPPR